MLTNKEQFEVVLAKLGTDIALARTELQELLEKKELLKQVGEQEVLKSLIDLLANSNTFVDKINSNYSKLQIYHGELEVFRQYIIEISDKLDKAQAKIEVENNKVEDLLIKTRDSISAKEKELVEMDKKLKKDLEFIKLRQKQLDDYAILQASREARLKAVYNKLNIKE